MHGSESLDPVKEKVPIVEVTGPNSGSVCNLASKDSN